MCGSVWYWAVGWLPWGEPEVGLGVPSGRPSDPQLAYLGYTSRKWNNSSYFTKCHKEGMLEDSSKLYVEYGLVLACNVEQCLP